MSAKPSPPAKSARKRGVWSGAPAGGKPNSPASAARPGRAADAAPNADPSPTAAPHRIRLQRALAAAGFGSRRQCEELILEGRVIVDGQVADQLGISIDERTAKVFVDGTPLRPRRLLYYILNKPTGVVTTNSDPEGRPRVIDLVPPDERVFPVGRLDRSSEGLILLTNDGDLAQRLTHPRYEIQKVYRVTVAGQVLPETLRQMQRGIYIAEGLVRVEGARVLKARPRATELEITLKEGKNREIRRILARLGHKVQTLRRIAIGPLRLGEMPLGAYRRLTTEEIKKLKRFAENSVPSTAPPRRSRTASGSKRPPRAAGRGAAASRGGQGRAAAKPAEPQGPLSLQEVAALVSVRTGAVIGADPQPPREASAGGDKPHVIRPRTAKSAGGARRGAQGRGGKARRAAGKAAAPGRRKGGR